MAARVWTEVLDTAQTPARHQTRPGTANTGINTLLAVGPDGVHGGHRNDPCNNDGNAAIAGGVRARVPVAVVGTTGLCMCSEG
eukprot:8055114-Alexandrium_andersonii.AAC.1